VAGLALVALWRVGPPPTEPATAGTSGAAIPQAVAAPLTSLAEVVAANAVGRQASLESVEVREIVGPRTFWIGTGAGERAFVVLDPDVKRTGGEEIATGRRLTLIGLVRPAPDIATAIGQWQIDEATAKSLVERGTYLHVTEIRPS
jgi:hypothetical protein